MKKIQFYADNDTSDDAAKIMEKIKKDLFITEDDERIARMLTGKEDIDPSLFAGDGPYSGSIRIKDENGNIVYDDSQ